MKKRIVFGAAMIVLIAGLLVLDWHLEARSVLGLRAVPLAVILMPVLAVAFVELAGLASAAGAGVLTVSGSLGAMALAGLPFWWQYTRQPLDGFSALAVLGLLSLPIFLEQMILYRIADAMRRVSMTLLAVVYLGAGFAVMMAIRLKMGVGALVLFLAVVKSADIAAYFVGSAVGRHKLIPWLSPGKSWEGLAAALAAGAIVSVFVAMALRMDLGTGRSVVLGVVLAAAGQVGDLCESLLKRSAGAKDSGALVPEFGGALDILDSLLLSAPLAYLLLN